MDAPVRLRFEVPDENAAVYLAVRPGGGDVMIPRADVEREHVLRVIEACGGSQTQAAQVLGIGRNTLWRKLQRYA